jgi:ATP-dependent DNA helicase RecQ
LTPASQAVLFNGRKVKLYRLDYAKERAKEAAPSRPKSKRMQLIEDLFERLRELRYSLSQKAGIPPYLVFNDATLQEMAAERPTNEAQMRNISGVGQAKFRQYGHIFIEEIIRFILEKREEGANIKGSTYVQTFDLLRQSLSVSEVARLRGLNPGTVYSHIGKLYELAYPIELERFISAREQEAVAEAIAHTSSDKLNDLHEVLQGEVAYDKIRLGVSIWQTRMAREG